MKKGSIFVYHNCIRIFFFVVCLTINIQYVRHTHMTKLNKYLDIENKKNKIFGVNANRHLVTNVL